MFLHNKNHQSKACQVMCSVTLMTPIVFLHFILEFLLFHKLTSNDVDTQSHDSTSSDVISQKQCTVSTWLLTRDVRNRFSFIWVRFFKLWFDSEWVRFGSKNAVCYDITVIYHSCNIWVVNLQQILQWQWMTWLWRQSQQRQQVNNVITF